MKDHCPRCQAEKKNADRFCGECGFRLNEEEVLTDGTRVEMKMSDIQLNLATVYFKRADYQETKRLCEKILVLEPGNKSAQELLEKAAEAEETELTKG